MSGNTTSSQPLLNEVKVVGNSICSSSVRLAEPQIKMNGERVNEKRNLELEEETRTDKHEQFATSQDIRNLKKMFLLLATLNVVLICVCSAVVIHNVKESDNTRQYVESIPSSATSVDEIKKVVQENLASNDSMRVVQKYIFCASCDTVRDVQAHFYKSADNTRCCIESISTLIRILNYTFSKDVNEYNSNIRSLKLSTEDLKEEINILKNALFSSNETNVADDIPSESVMWAIMQKNNRLINTLLNRRRSVLHLSGTAGSNAIHWTVELQSGVLSYDDDRIHVKSGGKYLILSNIHFSKRVCDGTESFGYIINQEYSQGEFLPIAQVQKGCAAGSRIDSSVHVQSLFEVGLGQHKKLTLEYDRNNHKFIATENKLHDIIVFEI